LALTPDPIGRKSLRYVSSAGSKLSSSALSLTDRRDSPYQFRLYRLNDVNEGHSSPARQAPVPVVAVSALLWIQGAIWAALGAVYVVYAPQKTAAAGLVTATLFGFTALSGTLAVLLPRPGSDRARHAAITLQCFMVFLCFAVLIASLFLLVLLMPVGFIALMGAFAAGCAVAGLLSAPARDHCRPHPTVR
jgi:hypothetical protein